MTGTDRASWIFILIITVVAVAASDGILLLRHRWLMEEAAISMLPDVKRPYSPPVEINENFLGQVNECFIPVAAAYGYTLRVTSEFRSQEEQERLFNQGRVEDGHIVTWAPPGKSLHNYGFAVDVVDRWRGYETNWKRLGVIASFCGISQVDDAHFEHRGGLTTAQFEEGMRPLPLTLPCALLQERAKEGMPLTPEDLKECGAPTF